MNAEDTCCAVRGCPRAGRHVRERLAYCEVHLRERFGDEPDHQPPKTSDMLDAIKQWARWRIGQLDYPRGLAQEELTLIAWAGFVP